MTYQIEDQLRDYFTHVDSAQGAVDISAISSRSELRPAFESNRHHTEPETFVLDQDSPTDAPDRRRSTWPLAAAAAVVALVGGLFFLARDEAGPVLRAGESSDETSSVSATSPTSTSQAPDAGQLPFPGDVAEPGRVATDALGVDVAFDIPVPMALSIGRANQLMLFEVADPAPTPDLGNTFELYRVAGLRTRAESSSPFDDASIDPLDIDRWITESGVVVLDDREIEVDSRVARVLDVTASPEGPDAVPDDCPPELAPCRFWAAFAGGVANPGSVFSAQAPMRLYIVPIGDHEPLAIVSAGYQSDEWDDFIESTVIPTIEIGPDAPAAAVS
jgi:hypothetical protein